ncbi:hypothetical protein HO505_10465 [Streptococcus suis]|nr:hypothetical protein [Streptococcus suis]
MASVDWIKNKGGTNEGFSRMAHATRHDGKDVEYNNKHVNKELSHLNYEISAKGGGKRTAHQELNRLKQRIEHLDKIHPPKRVRKDRVTTVSFEVPTPDNLKPEDESKFFSIAYSEIARTCGGMKNVTNGYVHNDEKHEYFDPIKKEFVTSRAHMHMQGIAWTDDFGINGKNFMTRERIIELNKRIDERCRKELGISFLKEEVSQHNEKWLKVEDLKRESALALEKRVTELEELKEQMRSEALKRNELIKRLNEKIELQERELNDLSVVDRLKEFLSGNESDRALTLADELTEKRTSELNQRTKEAEIRAYKAEKRVKEVSEEKERWKKAYYIENAEKEELKLDNQFLSRTISVMQKAFDKVESFLKGLGANVWQRFKFGYRNQDFEEYQRFQSIRHNESLDGKASQRRGREYDLDR